MNIQIFGTSKCFDTKKAQRYFKEYRKLHTAAQVLSRLLEEGEEEYRYLQQVQYAISEAATEE